MRNSAGWNTQFVGVQQEEKTSSRLAQKCTSKNGRKKITQQHWRKLTITQRGGYHFNRRDTRQGGWWLSWTRSSKKFSNVKKMVVFRIIKTAQRLLWRFILGSSGYSRRTTPPAVIMGSTQPFSLCFCKLFSSMILLFSQGTVSELWRYN